MKEQGKVGFDEHKKAQSEDIMTKEESMFRIDANGEVIPEKYHIELYDRDLDFELMEEALQLTHAIKKRDSIRKTMIELKKKQDEEITQLKNKIKNAKSDDEKKQLRQELVISEQSKSTEEVKEMINSEMVEQNIQESQMILRELNDKITETKQVKYVELKPCNVTESYYAFEKGLSVEGEYVDDWVDDLIIKKITNPKYSIEEVKQLKRDYKIALKEAIMKVSNYKTKNYKDIIIENNIKGTLREKKC